VHEGFIGSFYSHSPMFCFLGNATSVPISPSDGNTYYLVVPDNGRVEGSYGLASGNVERPPAAPGCLPHLAGACPP